MLLFWSERNNMYPPLHVSISYLWNYNHHTKLYFVDIISIPILWHMLLWFIQWSNISPVYNPSSSSQSRIVLPPDIDKILLLRHPQKSSFSSYILQYSILIPLRRYTAKSFSIIFILMALELQVILPWLPLFPGSKNAPNWIKYPKENGKLDIISQVVRKHTHMYCYSKLENNPASL